MMGGGGYCTNGTSSQASAAAASVAIHRLKSNVRLTSNSMLHIGIPNLSMQCVNSDGMGLQNMYSRAGVAFPRII
jgi:hypothetical protein